MHSIFWILVEAGTSLVEIILIFTFLNAFLNPKELPVKRKIFALLGAFTQLFLGSTFLYDIPNMLTINFFMITIIMSWVLYKGKPVHIFFSCVLLLAIMVVVELISMCIVVLTMNVGTAQIPTDPVLKFICVVIKNILSFTAVRIICSFRKSTIREMGIWYLPMLLIVPVICIIVTLVILDLVIDYKIQNLTNILMAYLGLMYVNVIVFAIFEALVRQQDKAYKYKIIQKQLELQLNHYNKLAESRSQLSEVIHDFKNHLNCLYNLYKYNNKEELGRYIDNLITITDVEKVIDTGNPVIDALLDDKYNAAHKIGIDFKKDLNLPSNLKIEPTDICAVLGNSLDNAIEACKRMSNNGLHKEISLSMTYRNSYLIIVVTNSTDQIPLKEGKFFRSSKPSPELHGLGMHSIERTVKKYGGNMVVKCDQGHFKLEIVMLTA